MPNKKDFFIALFILTLGVVGSIVFLILQMLALSIASLFIIIFGANKMLEWNTNNFAWKCDKCKTVFTISKTQNILGINGGLNRKLLYCEKCRKRRWCDAVQKN